MSEHPILKYLFLLLYKKWADHKTGHLTLSHTSNDIYFLREEGGGGLGRLRQNEAATIFGPDLRPTGTSITALCLSPNVTMLRIA